MFDPLGCVQLNLVVRERLVERLAKVGAHLPALHVLHQVALAVAVATQLLQVLPEKKLFIGFYTEYQIS